MLRGISRLQRAAEKMRADPLPIGLLPIIAVMGALLSGCGVASSNVRPAPCDWLVSYQSSAQMRAADELASLPRDAALRVLIEDYGELRARLRAWCEGR